MKAEEMAKLIDDKIYEILSKYPNIKAYDFGKETYEFELEDAKILVNVEKVEYQ
jgi:hypothetical protein